MYRCVYVWPCLRLCIFVRVCTRHTTYVYKYLTPKLSRLIDVSNLEILKLVEALDKQTERYIYLTEHTQIDFE